MPKISKSKSPICRIPIEMEEHSSVELEPDEQHPGYLLLTVDDEDDTACVYVTLAQLEELLVFARRHA